MRPSYTEPPPGIRIDEKMPNKQPECQIKAIQMKPGISMAMLLRPTKAHSDVLGLTE